MKDYILLSKDNCPQCENLKKMLAKPMKGKFDDVIQVVHKETNPEEFDRYAKEYNIQSTPAIISLKTDTTLNRFDSGPRIAAFLSS
jgi:glutaredoxin